MIIKVFTICWNEEKILPYFLRHYEQFADKIVVFDNYSDDNSPSIVKNHPKAELRFFDTNGKAREDKEIKVKSNGWKKHKKGADWVIVVDTDEFLYHPKLVDYLKSCKRRGITMPIPTGYNMVGDHFPTTKGQIYDEVTHGIKEKKFDKYAVFDPHHIDEINYGPGCHPAKRRIYQPTGTIEKEKNTDLKLLHYKFLGLDWIKHRYEALAERKSKRDLNCGYGKVYFSKPEVIEQKYKENVKQRKKII
jgi:glycosyltransferase involved in cell wall biosynthesis